MILACTQCSQFILKQLASYAILRLLEYYTIALYEHLLIELVYYIIALYKFVGSVLQNVQAQLRGEKDTSIAIYHHYLHFSQNTSTAEQRSRLSVATSTGPVLLPFKRLLLPSPGHQTTKRYTFLCSTMSDYTEQLCRNKKYACMHAFYFFQEILILAS